MNVWVTRPHPGLAETAAALRAAGHRAIEAPVLEVVTVPAQLPLESPDWIVLVSANAARGLVSAGVAPGARVAAVGRKTADVARNLGLEVEVVPAEERATGLIAALEHEDLGGKRVWIPAGDRPGSATRDLPSALRRRGASVHVFQVYETRARALSETELAELASIAPGAIVVFSPSAAEVLYTGPCPAEALAWRERATPVAIGPVTRDRLVELGRSHTALAREPSNAAVLEAIQTIEEKP